MLRRLLVALKQRFPHAHEQYAAGRPYVRHFGSFSYAAQSWTHERHGVMKAEVSAKGENPRFVVTSLHGFPPELLYDAYRERGAGVCPEGRHGLCSSPAHSPRLTL